LDKPLTVFAVGDVFNALDDSWAAFRHLPPLFASADIVFGNSEGVYSDNPARSPSCRTFHGAPRRYGERLGDVPFHVMNVANNHVLDGGYRGMEDTLDLFELQGIAPVGVGATLAEAASPTFLERKGKRVAFLGFCAVFPIGYEARRDRPGLAPLRVRTHYSNPDPYMWDAGDAPIITTEVDAADLALFRTSITTARRDADIVIVACHWGHSPQIRAAMKPSGSAPCDTAWRDVMQDYEVLLARDAVNHGADAVVCHHQLSLRAVELHKGKPIFYGLGILINHFDSPQLHALLGADPAWPHFPFRPESRKTGIAVLDFGPGDALRAGFIPARILPDGSTEPLRAGEPDAAEIASYLAGLCEQSPVDTKLTLETREGWSYIRIG
jgi:poly-gamma-glutamate synthesis protein (capsule biosynthesis protein)